MKKTNDRGAALIIVLLIMLIFIVLSSALLIRWNFDANQARHEVKSLQAFYIARSGADALGTYILTNPDSLSNEALKNRVDLLVSDGASGDTSDAVSLGNGNCTLQVTRASDNPSLLKIKSTGSVDNVDQSVTLVLQETAAVHLNEDGSFYYIYSWSFKGWEFKPFNPEI